MTTPSDSPITPSVSPNGDNEVNDAKSKVERLDELAEKAKIALASATDSQKSTAAVLADVQTKLTGITTASTSASETQRQIASILTDAQTKIADISAVATLALAAKTQLVDTQAVIATKSVHIENAQDHANKVRDSLDRELTTVKQHVADAEGQKTRAQSAADSATELLTIVRTAKGSVDKDAEAVAIALKTAEQATAATQTLADKSATVEERVKGYEKRLAELESKCTAQLKTIEGLLPGATSAGLASAFDSRRQTFLKPHNRWQWLFVGSVLALVVLCVPGMWHIYRAETIPSYDELGRLWLARFPIAAALVWLAIYANRESALAKRLEEDYGYKAAIASCFEGFKNQVSQVGANVPTDSALAKLLDNTLASIASPPGRIYEKHELTVSLADEVKKAAQAVINVAKETKGGDK